MSRPAPPAIPLVADERTMLLSFLDFYRAEFVDRAFGLSYEQLQAPHPPSTLTLARLVGHMAFVELIWFCERFDGEELPPPFNSLDFDADPDAEMTMAAAWPVDRLLAEFHEATANARRRVDCAASLDQLSARTNRAGERWSLRWILVHMIEEYARHAGHADLIREAIDGDVAS